MPTTINGTTGIDAVQPGTITQADLATNVAGNGPAFMAYQSTLQSLANITTTPVMLQTEDFDAGNNFASSVFTAPVSGHYQFNLGVQVASAPTDLQLVLRKNGAVLKFAGRSTTTLVAASSLEYANAGDTFDVTIYQASGAAINTTAGRATFFSGFLARAA